MSTSFPLEEEGSAAQFEPENKSKDSGFPGEAPVKMPSGGEAPPNPEIIAGETLKVAFKQLGVVIKADQNSPQYFNVEAADLENEGMEILKMTSLDFSKMPPGGQAPPPPIIKSK